MRPRWRCAEWLRNITLPRCPAATAKPSRKSFRSRARDDVHFRRAVGSNVRSGSIATKIDHSGHFRLSLNSGSTEDIALAPVRARSGLTSSSDDGTAAPSASARARAAEVTHAKAETGQLVSAPMAAKVASIVAWLLVTTGTPRRCCSSGRASTARKLVQETNSRSKARPGRYNHPCSPNAARSTPDGAYHPPAP
jgi:hypothetical protein